MQVIPPPTEFDYKHAKPESLYAWAEGLDTTLERQIVQSIAKRCAEAERLLAAERKQNAERGELLKDVERHALIAIGVCDPDILVCQWCEAEAADGKRESIKHDPDCLVERARRAGVNI